MTRLFAGAGRRAFTLLEVIVALAVLVVCLLILVESQANAVYMTMEAERYVTGTQLAQEKLNEVLLLVEYESFTDQSIDESGDFSDFGDEALDLEMGDKLRDFRWRYTVEEIDLAQLGDIAGLAQELAGDQQDENASSSTSSAAAARSGQQPGGNALGGLSAFLSPDALTDMLGKYIRQVHVYVWWVDDDLDVAEENGHLVHVTAHVINPNGAVRDIAQEQATQ